MISEPPRLQLFTEPSMSDASCRNSLMRWSFRFVRQDQSILIAATDFESKMSFDRLALLAVVRGLEALDEPSQIAYVNPSRYVSRGLHYGLERWRETSWRWERFGQMVLVRNADLWQRVDAALQYHKLECVIRRVDGPNHRRVRKPFFASQRRRRAGKANHGSEALQVA